MDLGIFNTAHKEETETISLFGPTWHVVPMQTWDNNHIMGWHAALRVCDVLHSSKAKA